MTLLERITEVLSAAECNHDDLESVMGYCQALRAALEAFPVNSEPVKQALTSIVTAIEGRTGALELVEEIDDILERIDVPEGYWVYQTLVGTWRWSKGKFGTSTWVDGENLPTREEAVQDAIAHAARQQKSAE